MKVYLLVLLALAVDIGTAARCQLRYYKGSEFRPRSARVHTGFLSKMRTINGYARDCGVKVYVTSSYRRTSRVKGAIVKPAVRSNHMIGHAIDMNLWYSGGFCNSRCLKRGPTARPRSVNCFIGKIRGDAGLRWGGNFRRRDVVHIDDGTNIRNRRLWNRIFYSVQRNC